MVSPSAIAKEKIEKPEEKQTSELAHEAKSAILIERDTGKVLFTTKTTAMKKLAPASMTKIMTMLLIMEAIDQGKLKMTDKVRTSDHANTNGRVTNLPEPEKK
ncbi:hypothetical protein ACEQPO_18055 [Bacillus sp. SL00103]